MAETIVIDPNAVAVSRSQLDITGWIKAAGVDWGDAAITAYMAEQAVGSSPVDYRLPNRTVAIPLMLKDLGATSYATIVTELQQKVALLQREGGWLMRQVDATPLYADVVNATLHLGGSWLQSFRSADVDAALTLECVPDWYGDEVTLDSIASSVGTALSVLKLSTVQAQVGGGYPGRCRIVVTDTSGNDQKGLVWGLRSRYYDSAPTAALFYEAEALTPVNGAATAVLSGASGGSVVTISSLPTGNWVGMLTTTILSGTAPLTHKGTYRVWVRAYSATGQPQVRLRWGVGSLSIPTTNTAVAIPGSAAFYLLDLGTIRLDASPVGSHQWIGAIEAYSTPGGDSASIDAVYFQPVDDGAGRLISTPSASVSAAAIESGDHFPQTGADNSGVGTITWSNPGYISAYADGLYATAAVTAAATSHYLVATAATAADGTTFNIPAGATIAGIRTTIYRYARGGGSSIADSRIRLVKAGVVQATDRSMGKQWSSSLGWSDYYGSPTDLWGTAWTPSDINNSGFGMAFACVNNGSHTGTAYVDTLVIDVFYTLAAGFAVAADAVVYASQTAEIRFDGAIRTASSSVYGPVANVIGDLPRLPPSGLEARAIELLVKPSRGDLATLADSGLDGFTAQVKYRPSYLFKP